MFSSTTTTSKLTYSLEDLIKKAVKTFTPGYRINRNKTVKIDLKLTDQAREEALSLYKTGTMEFPIYENTITHERRLTRFAQAQQICHPLKLYYDEDSKSFGIVKDEFYTLFDPHFPKIAANFIKDTKLIASKGPASNKGLNSFIANTIFNPVISNGVRKIIALGNNVRYPRTQSDPVDFVNYFTSEGIAEVGELKDFKVYIEDASKEKMSSRSVLHTTSVNSAKPETRHAEVYFFKVEDNETIDITDDKTKETLLKLYYASLKEPIVIHCAAGIGRTGYLILLFEILKHYDKIFNAASLEEASANLQAILERLRESRSLVNTPQQMTSALEHAYTLRQYELDKKPDFKPEKEFVCRNPKETLHIGELFKKIQKDHSELVSLTPSRVTTCKFDDIEDANKFATECKLLDADSLRDCKSGSLVKKNSDGQYEVEISEQDLAKIKTKHGYPQMLFNYKYSDANVIVLTAKNSLALKNFLKEHQALIKNSQDKVIYSQKTSSYGGLWQTEESAFVHLSRADVEALFSFFTKQESTKHSIKPKSK